MIVNVADVAAPADQWTDEERRIWRANKQRIDVSKPSAVWAAKEIAYHCVLADPRLSFFVLVRMPLGVDAVATTAPGQRVVRLLYEWQVHIEPAMVMAPDLTPAALRDRVLVPLAAEGERLRAAIRYARSGRNMDGFTR